MMKFKLGLLGVVVTALAGCGGSSGGSSIATGDACNELNNDTFNCSQMLSDIVEFGVRPSTTALSTSAQTLHDTTDAYCAALGNNTEAATLTSAKDAWASAMVEVQQLNAMEFGPLANSETGLEAIYAWPTVSSCLVDLQVMSAALGPDNRGGLYAMEYLLYGPEGAVSCTKEESSSVVNWAAEITAAEIQTARCDYAQLVADDLVTKTAALATAMNEYDLAAANDSLQQSAGLVSDALFYIDKQTKDVKVKALLPQADNDSFHADAVESQFARLSKEHIKYNLVGARKVFTADSHMGLDDYLAAADKQSIADDMLATLDAAIANLDAVSSNADITNDSVFDIVTAGGDTATCMNLGSSGVYDDASSDIDTLCALQYSVKQFTDILKGDFTLMTSFTVPATADGDAD